MLKKLIYLTILLISFVAGWLFKDIFEKKEMQPLFTKQIKERPLEKYAFENLSQTIIDSGNLEIRDTLKETDDFNSHLFIFEFNPNLDRKIYKKVTGQINIPKEGDSFPLIIMLRGYIDKTLFRTGDGTRNASEFFAKNGFITIAPDFLGYGNSDKEAENIFEVRFQTYVTAISLLNSIDQIGKWNQKNVFLWGHSNGGQIALTVLEITQKYLPTTLWNPVSKPFPYSVLFYTDESEDGGKLIRTELSKFEKDYDVNKFSLTNYFDKINTPIQVQQGASDETVPRAWSDTLVMTLKQLDKDVIYHIYPATDHNMRPSWETAVGQDLGFFKKYL